MRTIRCSSLPRIMGCPQSGMKPEGDAVEIGNDNEAARLGSAIHELLAGYVRTGDLPDEKYRREIALKYNILHLYDDLDYLFGTGWVAWDELRSQFGEEPLTEMELRSMLTEDIELTGHADVVGDRGELVRGLDWKSGRKPNDHYHQMAGYAFDLLDAFLSAQSVSLTLVWLRERTIETLTWTRKQATAWAAETAGRLRSELYCPGENCRYCPRQTNCPARTALVRSVISDLTNKEIPIPALTAVAWAALSFDLASAWSKIRIIESVVERLKAVVRDGVERFGSLSLSDKTELRLTPIAASKTLKTKEAWPVVTELLTEDELSECIKIELKKVEEVVMRKIKRGGKGKAKEALIEKLKQADAVAEKQNTPRLNEVRKEVHA